MLSDEVLTRAQDRLLRLRLHNQQLDAPSSLPPEQIVASLGAMQSQDYASAKWAIGLRSVSLTDADVERACDAGAILRTHVLRPTWHFVTPADIRWMLALTGPRVQAFNRSYHRKMEIDDAMLAGSLRAIEKAFKADASQTRVELATALRRVRIDVSGIRLAFLVMHAELEGVICSGPRRGKQFTYSLLDARAPHAATLAHDEALAELTRRFFTSHGPASLRDYAWWSGLSVKEARAGIEMVRSRLDQAIVDEVTYWFVPPTTVAPKTGTVPRRRRSSHLLPNFDEYVVAYQDRHLAIPPVKPGTGLSIGTLGSPHPLVVDGRLTGSWRRTLKGPSTIVTIVSDRVVTAPERQAIARSTARYSRFAGTPVVVNYLR